MAPVLQKSRPQAVCESRNSWSTNEDNQKCPLALDLGLIAIVPPPPIGCIPAGSRRSCTDGARRSSDSSEGPYLAFIAFIYLALGIEALR